jgi:hypothetical protein
MTQDAQENPLEFCTDDDLVDELARRYDRGLIVSGEREAMGKEGSELTDTQSWHRHGFNVCIGLASRLCASLTHEAVGRSEYTTDEE